MEKLTQEAVNWVKNLNVSGCLSGSCLLNYFEGQDVDLFCYTEKAYAEVLWAMYWNPLFHINDPLEQWKFDQWRVKRDDGGLKKWGIQTSKFKYNMAIDMNVIYKKYHHTAFDVAASFDMDVVAKAYDLQTKQILDLTGGASKIAKWNIWNPNFRDVSIWDVKKIMRQFGRVVKYHNRGINTDNVTLKYIEFLEENLQYNNLWESVKVEEKIKTFDENVPILIKRLKRWLKEHDMSQEELDKMKQLIKKL